MAARRRHGGPRVVPALPRGERRGDPVPRHRRARDAALPLVARGVGLGGELMAAKKCSLCETGEYRSLTRELQSHLPAAFTSLRSTSLPHFNLTRTRARPHSALTPDSARSLAHWAISLPNSFPNAAGDPTRTSPPVSAKRAFMAGSA